MRVLAIRKSDERNIVVVSDLHGDTLFDQFLVGQLTREIKRGDLSELHRPRPSAGSSSLHAHQCPDQPIECIRVEKSVYIGVGI